MRDIPWWLWVIIIFLLVCILMGGKLEREGKMVCGGLIPLDTKIEADKTTYVCPGEGKIVEVRKITEIKERR